MLPFSPVWATAKSQTLTLEDSDLEEYLGGRVHTLGGGFCLKFPVI